MRAKALVHLFLTLLALPSIAAEFAVSPMLINVESAGGTIEPFEISVTGKADGKIRLSLFSMEQVETGHMNFLETGLENQPELNNWIQFDQSNYAIKRDESTVIKGSVRIPRGTQGTFLTAVMIEEDIGDSKDSIVLKVRYAVILNISVGKMAGRVVTEFDRLNLVEIDGTTFVEGFFTNRHSHMGFLDSNAQVRGSDRRLVGKIPLKTDSAWQRGDNSSRVYPGATVRVFGPIPRALASGEYQLMARNQFNGRTQPVTRNTIAYTSTLIRSDNQNLITVTNERIEVVPMRSGMSITPIALMNPTAEAVTLKLPSGANPGQGIEAFKFIPESMTLQPGASRQVMLKQTHLTGTSYQAQAFTLLAENESGFAREIEVNTYPESKSEVTRQGASK